MGLWNVSTFFYLRPRFVFSSDVRMRLIVLVREVLQRIDHLEGKSLTGPIAGVSQQVAHVICQFLLSPAEFEPFCNAGKGTVDRIEMRVFVQQGLISLASDFGL